MASSSGLFPEPLPSAARRCLDEVPPFGADEVRRMIAEDLGRPPNLIFKDFDHTPLSAASIGQVHACTLPDGRTAVVKLRSEEHTSELQSLMRISYAVFCLKKKKDENNRKYKKSHYKRNQDIR